MRQYSIGTITLPTFTVDPLAENYWNERLSFEYCRILSGMGTNNFILSQSAPSDFSELDAQYSTMKGEIEASFAEGGDKEIADYIPTLAFLAARFLGIADGGMLLLLKIAIWIFFKFLEGRGSSGDMKELVEELKKSNDILKAAWMEKKDEGGNNELENLISLLYLLANPELRVEISQFRGTGVDLQSIHFNE